MQADQKGSITRGDLQKGLLTLRVFKVTAKMIPFPRASEDGIDRMDLLQFLVLCAWDDSLNKILSMERSEIEERMEDSYNRREQISRAALEEVVKSTVRSNADLKAQVLQGLTDLPDLFVADGPRPPRARGSQTDRSHGRVVNKRDAVLRKNDGSHTDRTERKRDKEELRSEPEKFPAAPERVAAIPFQEFQVQDANYLQVQARGRHTEVKPHEKNHAQEEPHKEDELKDPPLMNSLQAEQDKLAFGTYAVPNARYEAEIEGRHSEQPGQTNMFEVNNGRADINHHEVQALRIAPESPLSAADKVSGVAEPEECEDDWYKLRIPPSPSPNVFSLCWIDCNVSLCQLMSGLVQGCFRR